MIGPVAKFVRASNPFKIVLRYFGKVWRKLNVCIIRSGWLTGIYIFTLLPPITSFRIINCFRVREEVSYVVFFLQTQLQHITVQGNIFGEFALALLTFGLCTSPTDTFTFTYYFRLCPFLSDIASTDAPFALYKISNTFNARSTSSIILSEEGVPIFDYHIRFSPLVITTFILARRYALVSSDRPQQLTSYAVTSHSSPDCHLSLLWYVYCMLKCYWYLFYILPLHNLPSSLRYYPSWPHRQSIMSDLLIIPHHCCGILQKSCTHHWGEPTSFKLPHQL